MPLAVRAAGSKHSERHLLVKEVIIDCLEYQIYAVRTIIRYQHLEREITKKFETVATF